MQLEGELAPLAMRGKAQKLVRGRDQYSYYSNLTEGTFQLACIKLLMVVFQTPEDHRLSSRCAQYVSQNIKLSSIYCIGQETRQFRQMPLSYICN